MTNPVDTDAPQLPTWPHDIRALPNVWAHSALFSVRNKQIPRAALENAELFHINPQVKIIYTGIELRAEDDELVWQQIIDYAKHAPFGHPVEFSYYQLCKDLDWPINGHYYQKAEDCLNRLQATKIEITTQRVGTLRLSMIDKLGVIESSAEKARCLVHADPGMINLFADNHFAKIEWSHYRKLSPTARRLYDYIAAHRASHPIGLEVFRQLCGSDSSRLAKWAEQARKACSEIEAAGLVSKAWVEKGKVCYEKPALNARKDLAGAAYLYRHFDSKNNLLYVGVSLNAVNRLSQHKANSAWFASIKRIELERFPSRDEALMAERTAVANEGPLYNILHRQRIIPASSSS